MDAKQKTCKNNGCRKKYVETDNHEKACLHHPGKPIFHDTKKGWTCCNKIVYDWDDFQKLPHCAQGSTVSQRKGGAEFFKSNTVDNAKRASDKAELQGIVIKDITKFNEEFEAKKKKEEEQAKKTQKLFVTKDGNNKCTNKGCNKQFKADDNTETSCNFHKGQPVFHDLKKYWTCCGKQTYDWDDFVKLPTCSVGKHIPKMA